MSSDTFSTPQLFIGNKEITSFKSVQFSETGKSLASSLNITLNDPELRHAPLDNKEVLFFLNYGSKDTVPFFRGLVRQVIPSENNIKIVANDVRTLLTGNESIPLSLTDTQNYDGYTLAQFIYEYITTNINVNETLIGLDLLRETDPVVSLSGYRGKKLNPLKIIKANIPKNDDNLKQIKQNRLAIIDDGVKSNITFVKEQDLDDAAVRFSYSNGITNIKVRRRPPPNLLSAEVGGQNVVYKHNNLSKGVRGAKIEGNFSYPDEAIQAAYVQATYAELDSEITLTTTKGHYLSIGNVIYIYSNENSDQTGKFRILSKQVTCSKSGTTCTLQIGKEKPEVNQFF